MRYLHLLVALLSILAGQSAAAQPASVKNFYNTQSIFCEVGGHARGLLSCNYERIFKGPVKNTLWTVRSGVGLAPGTAEDDIPGEKFQWSFTIIVGYVF